jgi:phage-related protein
MYSRGYSRRSDSAQGKGARRKPKAKSVDRTQRAVKRRWRDYQTASGRRPIKDFLDGLDDEDLASVIAAMKEVRQQGLQAARHLGGEIHEVRADGKGVIYRVLFAAEGKHEQVFLSLEAIKKKTQRTPPQTIRLAKRRLLDWQRRGK